jgi:hypothetical protein
MRLSWLRWAKAFDYDDWRASTHDQRQKQERERVCQICGLDQGLRYPAGFHGGAWCQAHSPADWKSRVTAELAEAANCGVEPPQGEVLEYAEGTPKLRKCPLCLSGEATIHHWTCQCPVPALAAQIICADELWKVFASIEDKFVWMRTVVLLHQVRLLVRRKGAACGLNSPIDYSTTPAQNLVELITCYRTYVHASLINPKIFAKIPPTPSERCPQNDVNLVTAGQAPPQFQLTGADYLLVAAESIQKGTRVMSVPVGQDLAPIIAKSGTALPMPYKGTNANAMWGIEDCGCRDPCLKVIATKDITTGEPIVIAQQRYFATGARALLAMFDGSCIRAKDRDPACGAGVVIYATHEDLIVEELARISYPLPNNDNSFDAEVQGAVRAVEHIVAFSTLQRFKDYQLRVYGDNLTVIDYWKGKARVRKQEVLDQMAQVHSLIRQTNASITWRYVPREWNPVADELANVGSKYVLSGGKGQFVDKNGAITAAPKGLIVSCFDNAPPNNSEVVSKAVHDIQDIIYEQPSTGEITLPEEYCFDKHIDLSVLKNKELFAILKYAKMRLGRATYKQAAGAAALSRHFVKKDGIAAFNQVSKVVRVILLYNHYEADISACHFAVMLQHTQGYTSPLFGAIKDVLEYVAANIKGGRDKAKSAKKILQRIISADADTVSAQLLQEDEVTMSTDLLQHLRKFSTEQRVRIANRMREKGFRGKVDAQDINTRNILYHACAAAETAIMLRALRNLLAAHGPDSLAWVHDGLYVKKSCCTKDNIRDAFNAAATELDWTPLTIKITDCDQEAIEAIEQRQPQTTNETGRELLKQIEQIEPLQDTATSTNLCIILDKPYGRTRKVFRQIKAHK